MPSMWQLPPRIFPHQRETSMISMIVATDLNGVIAKDGKIPWHCPEDFKFFKEKTIGKPIIMGKTTFRSLPKESPLPFRLNIVLDDKYDSVNHVHYGTGGIPYIFINNIDSAIDLCDVLCCGQEIMICGGLSVYKSFLDTGMVSKIYLNKIKTVVPCSRGDKILRFPAVPHSFYLKDVKDEEKFISLLYDFDYDFTEEQHVSKYIISQI